MNKSARIIVICVAAVAAIGLALVVRAMGSGQPAAVAVAEPAKPMARVLVAAKDLPPGSRLTEADLEWKDWPLDGVSPTYIVDRDGPQPTAKPEGAVAAVARAANEMSTGGVKADYVGSVVRDEIAAGEPIVARKIVRVGDSGYMAAYLEPGMRAMAIKVTVETAAGGFILPGDRVDVLLTRELPMTASRPEGAGRSNFVTSTVMQNIKVLAIDQTTRAEDDELAVVGATATLEVGSQDSEALALAKSEGELSLTLRSYADAAGPSGRTGAPASREPAAVKIYRGGPPEVVSVQ